MQFHENFYYWYPNNLPPFNDCVYASIEVVGVDEISGITVPFNPPVDYTSISFSRHENTLNISWNPVEYYAPPVFFDEVGNLILVESDSLEYEIYYNSKFDFKTCELEEFFIESDKINTKNSEISIELSNLDSEKCFYLNSKNGYSNLMPDYLVESNFIRCGCGESIELWQRCYDIQQAIFIDLMGSWISGIIPAEIGSLENLITLLLSGNELSGSIPVEIGNLKNLTSLRLNHNQLTGEIPAAIGELTNLNYLDLTYNQLTGEIPQEVCDLIESNNLPISTILEGNDDLINTCDD